MSRKITFGSNKDLLKVITVSDDSVLFSTNTEMRGHRISSLCALKYLLLIPVCLNCSYITAPF